MLLVPWSLWWDLSIDIRDDVTFPMQNLSLGLATSPRETRYDWFQRRLQQKAAKASIRVVGGLSWDTVTLPCIIKYKYPFNHDVIGPLYTHTLEMILSFFDEKSHPFHPGHKSFPNAIRYLCIWKLPRFILKRKQQKPLKTISRQQGKAALSIQQTLQLCKSLLQVDANSLLIRYIYQWKGLLW